MSWAHFIMLLCTIRLSQCSVCKLEIIPTSQNLWSWPYPHLHTYTLSVIHKPSSFYGYRFKITRDKIGKCFYQATSAFSLAAIILSKTKQNPQYLLSPWFIDSSAISNLLLNPSNKFFIYVIVHFNSRVFIWFFFIVCLYWYFLFWKSSSYST